MQYDTVKQLQDAQLKILKYADSVCGNLGINYYMLFGSLLGTIRHKGSIPWDFDIDIGLLREDYEIFASYLKKHNLENGFFLDDYSTDPNHFSPHILLRDTSTHLKLKNFGNILPKYDGIYIDIFPIDEVPRDKNARVKQGNNIEFLKKIVSYKRCVIQPGESSKVKIIAKHIVQMILAPISFRSLNRRIDEIMKQFSGCNSGYRAICTDYPGAVNQAVDFSVYGIPSRMTYEDCTVLVPCGWDMLLQKWYGDYMKLPPEDERGVFFEKLFDSVQF